MDVRLPDLTSSEWAAWVQAVGSIAAILVAVFVGWYQARSSAKSSEAAIEHSYKLLEDQRVERIVETFAAPLAVLDEFIEAVTDLAHQLHGDVERAVPAHYDPISGAVVDANGNEATPYLRPVQKLKRLIDAQNVFVTIAVPGFPSGQAVRLMITLNQLLNKTVAGVERVCHSLEAHSNDFADVRVLKADIEALCQHQIHLRQEAVRVAQPIASAADSKD